MIMLNFTATDGLGVNRESVSTASMVRKFIVTIQITLAVKTPNYTRFRLYTTLIIACANCLQLSPTTAEDSLPVQEASLTPPSKGISSHNNFYTFSTQPILSSAKHLPYGVFTVYAQ